MSGRSKKEVQKKEEQELRELASVLFLHELCGDDRPRFFLEKNVYQ